MPMTGQGMICNTNGPVSGSEPPQLANESWVNTKWRAAMAWLWFAVSGFDFIIFPILSAAFCAIAKIPYSPWQPITLQGGGLFHVAMGAVVGVSAWTRTQEKLAIYNAYSGSASDGSMMQQQPQPPPPMPPAPMPMPVVLPPPPPSGMGG